MATPLSLHLHYAAARTMGVSHPSCSSPVREKCSKLEKFINEKKTFTCGLVVKDEEASAHLQHTRLFCFLQAIPAPSTGMRTSSIATVPFGIPVKGRSATWKCCVEMQPFMT